jgi:NAD-dependent deacetylase
MRQIVNILQSSNNTVAITGAGISTEAGIPDFRGKDGIYTKLGGEDKVMSLINIDAFRRDPRNFYDFYWKHFDFPPVEPGQAHKVLANMEVKKFIKGVVTQNIDGLHQKAGSKNVIPIHGNMDQYICTACRELHSRDYAVTFRPTVPVCSKCKSILKPNVVFFGENIVNYYGAEEIIKNARCLLVIGTTLAVYPLAGFVESFNSFTQDLVIINRGPTHMDHAALMKVEVEEKDSLGEIMESIFKGLLTD